MFHRNPHCLQVFLNTGCNCKEGLPFSRLLEEDMPRVPYRRRTNEAKSVIHWGQRKLLMSEIEFLTLYAGSPMVIYAGAAPGTHIAFLSGMFPNVRFLLCDPAPFTVEATDKISIVQDLFTDEMAERLATEHPGSLFISDVRSADWQLDDEEMTDAKVKQDMERQKRWHLLLKPRRSMLKFRLPWDAGTTEYIDGDIHLPVWGPVTTTETRLISKENSVDLRPYDHKKYEEQLFYFNTVARPALYPHGVEGEGIDHCYDCRAEVEILTRYLRDVKEVPEERILREVSRMSRDISRQIASHRTLSDPNPDPVDRKRKIQRRQWINGRPAYER